jgi:hypothetical protein
MWRDLLLVPDSYPEDEPWIGDRFCSLTGEGSCTAKRSVVRKADVRGKFTAELIAQTYTRVDIGESRSNSALGILLAVEVHLKLGLCDQALSEQQFIGALYRHGSRTLAQIRRSAVRTPWMPTAPQTRFGSESRSARIPACMSAGAKLGHSAPRKRSAAAE